MNFNLYIFGKNKGRYSQFPDDYTSAALSELCDNVADSKAIILRDNNLMHYIFIENIGNDNIIGICVIFNRTYIQNISVFFSFMRGIIESTLLRNGKIIKYDDAGKILFTHPSLGDDVKSYEFVKKYIDTLLDNGGNYYGLSELTTVYNGLHNSETIEPSLADSEILKLSQRVNKIIIQYKTAVNENQSYAVINKLQKKLQRANETIASQKSDISKLEKAKKQYKKVLFLNLVLLGCIVGLYFLYTTLDKTERNLQVTTEELAVANDSISSLKNTVAENNNTISRLNSNLREETRLKEKAQNTLETLASRAPIVITGTSCSLSGQYYTVKYYSESSGNKDFRLKVYDESSKKIYLDRTFSQYIDSGNGTFTIYLHKYFNGSDWYTFELWTGNVLIGGSRH